jgi:2-hydroxychromene-2-carboxylate isomerase
VYRANFVEDLDISAPATVAACLALSGADPAALLTEAQSPEAKAELRLQTERASQLDVFGAPSFLVARELFWGNDRLEDALSWAVEHAS